MSKVIASSPAAHDDAVSSLVWTRQNLIFTGSIDECVSCWDPAALDKPLKQIKDQDLSVVSVACNDDGSVVASSSMDGHIRVYDAATREQRADINAGPMQCWSLAMHPTQPLVATGSSRGDVKVFSTVDGTAALSTTGEPHFVHKVAYSPDGALLAVGYADGSISLLDASTGASRSVVNAHAGPVRALAFSPDSALLLSGSDDRTARVTAVDGRRVGALSGHQSWVLGAAWSPNGRLLATACADRRVRVYDADTLALTAAIEAHQCKVWAVAFSPDSSKVASGGDDGSLCITACSDK